MPFGIPSEDFHGGFGIPEETDQGLIEEIYEYARVYFINSKFDFEELENHLSMNGYDFGIDAKRGYLFVSIDELDYIETILTDRNIAYGVSVC